MKNKPKIEATGRAEKRERRDGDEIWLTTFIPIKIRKRGGRAVVVRPAVAQVQAKTDAAHDQPLLTALSRRSTGSSCSTTGWSTPAAKSPSARGCTIRR